MDHQDIDYKNLPVQADVIAGIIRLDPESNQCFRELDNYLRSDQGVATLILRVVNSPMYSRGRQIVTIPNAITILGFNVVRSLSMVAFSRAMFSKTRDPLFRLHIWQHSLLTAIAGRSICQALGNAKARDEVFIAGLMHDMGKVLLFTHDAEGYAKVMALVLEGRCSSVEAEQQVFGFDHCQVGREAVRQWRLPPRFADFMGENLSVLAPEDATDPVRLSLTAANVLVKGVGIGGPPASDLESRRAALTNLGLNSELCDQWIDEEFMAGLMDDETYKLCASL